MKLFIFLCLLICLVKVHSRTGAIINGTDAEPGDAPYMVALYKNRAFVCGGALIARNKVLTAAHCVKNNAYYTVRGGIKDLAEIGFNISCSVTIHPRYNITPHANDIAVLTLEKDVDPVMFPEVRYAMLQKKGLRTDSKVRVFGWGQQVSNDRSSLSNYLKKTTLVVKHTRIWFYIAAKPRRYSSACYGDSGGPLESSDGKLAGIAASVTRNDYVECLVGKTNFFTKVSKYITWIEDQIHKV